MAKEARPAEEIRMGRIRCRIWEQRDGEKVWYSVDLSRSYEDQEGEHFAKSFGRDDLLVLGVVTQHAFLWIAQKERRYVEEGELPNE
jgi:hypothetical protein